MKISKESLMLSKHKNEFDAIAEYIKIKLNVDVKEYTESRAHNLPKYRCLFFNIAIKSTKTDYATVGSYLGKDHATICHAVKMWNNGVDLQYGSIYIDYFKTYKVNNLLSGKDKSLDYEQRIYLLKNEIVKLRIDNEKQKNKITSNIKNNSLKELLELDPESIDFFIKTRLEPFLKMNTINGKRKMFRIVKKSA